MQLLAEALLGYGEVGVPTILGKSSKIMTSVYGGKQKA